MNARLINSAAGVINAALTQNRTAAGIALALDSAQLLQSPEKAAELVALRNDALNMRGVLSPNGFPRRVPMPLGKELAPVVEWLLSRVAELEAELRIGSPWTCEVCSKENTRDVCVICETYRPEPRERTADEDPIAFALTAEAASVQPVCPVCQHPGCCCSCFGKTPRQDCTHQPAEEDVRPQVRKLRALLAGQRTATEDPHDSPLHHAHRIGRDLPSTGGA